MITITASDPRIKADVPIIPFISAASEGIDVETLAPVIAQDMAQRMMGRPGKTSTLTGNSVG